MEEVNKEKSLQQLRQAGLISNVSNRSSLSTHEILFYVTDVQGYICPVTLSLIGLIYEAQSR